MLLLAFWRTSVIIFSCSEYIEIFPFLREPVIENSTKPDYVICNRTTVTATSVSALTVTATRTASVATSLATDSFTTTKPMKTTSLTNEAVVNEKSNSVKVSTASSMATPAASIKKAMIAKSSAANHSHLTVFTTNNSAADVAVGDLRSSDEFIYSAGKIFGIRIRFKQQHQQQQQQQQHQGDVLNWPLNITGEYRFLKKEYFQNDGRLIPGSYCDYYFFADANAKPQTFEIWQYFHSPRFPAKYPAHIKCAYKFIGRPESRVEIVFEELQLPKEKNSCSMDKLTIFDSESANMNAVIDVICDALPTRRIISSGPDLLIEFNASSNITAKGFRGKFKFIHNEIENPLVPAIPNDMTTEKIIALERIGLMKATQRAVLTVEEWAKFFKDNGK
ncbi:uncharacterized protein LOC105664730 [Ceratitis capitata]|uniref:uncharacterized protein LOC105664730 n=1 Tax=Ceratitis capitata TaxID=7213 RepID=UPI00061892A0|nr:uncharacterized protein LOC105664730 [Ceratitis capitata]